MPVPCSQTCGDYTLEEWQILSEEEQLFLEYCALVSAAANYPGAGPFQPIGVYTNTVDADYIVPADASLVIWNVPGQTGTQEIDYSLVPEGSLVGIYIEDSNGQTVAGYSNLNDVAPRYENVRSIDGAGDVESVYGSAAGYEIGTSGPTVPLLNTANTWDGDQTFLDRILFPNFMTNNSQERIGSLEFQSFSAGNGWLGENVYYNGANFVYRSNGAAGLFYFFGTEGQFRFAPVGVAGANTGLGSGTACNFKVNADGTVSIGGFMGDGAGVYQGSLTANTAGTRIATSGTGGTVVAKLLTGLATMAGGTIAVADTFTATTSVVLVTPHFAPLGTLYVTKTAGVGFTINSTNAGDAGSVSYQRSVL